MFMDGLRTKPSAQFIETGAADPLEERFTALEARVAALEGK